MQPDGVKEEKLKKIDYIWTTNDEMEANKGEEKCCSRNDMWKKRSVKCAITHQEQI